MKKLFVIGLIVIASMSLAMTQVSARSLRVEESGDIATGDPCPSPRASKTYSEIQAAVDCAKSGDVIRIGHGVFEGAGWSDKNLQLVGKGPHRTFLRNGGFAFCSSKVSVEKMSIAGGDAFDGGGVEGTEGSHTTIKECVFFRNNADIGGAVQNEAGNKTIIEDSAFFANTAMVGGAINNGGHMKITNSVFGANTADRGAAIHNTGTVIVKQSLIAQNEAADACGGIFNDGGIVKLWHKPIITDNIPDDCVGCP